MSITEPFKEILHPSGEVGVLDSLASLALEPGGVLAFKHGNMNESAFKQCLTELDWAADWFASIAAQQHMIGGKIAPHCSSFWPSYAGCYFRLER
jgi:hypothetical protein